MPLPHTSQTQTQTQVHPANTNDQPISTTYTSDTLGTDAYGTGINGFGTHPWLGFEGLGAGASGGIGGDGINPLDWDSGGFGYDPSSIVSDIEEMLRAQGGVAGGVALFPGL